MNEIFGDFVSSLFTSLKFHKEPCKLYEGRTKIKVTTHIAMKPAAGSSLKQYTQNMRVSGKSGHVEQLDFYTITKLAQPKLFMVTMRCAECMYGSGASDLTKEEQIFFGRPSIISEKPVTAVKRKVTDDRRVTISELCDAFLEISRGTLHEVVRNCLGYCKLCAKWVLKPLTPEHLKSRMAVSLEFLLVIRQRVTTF